MGDDAKPYVALSPFSSMTLNLSRFRWLYLTITVYFGIMSYVVLLRYYSFQTNAFDLGLFNQAFSSTLHGKLFYETPDQREIPSGSFLGVHFNFLVFLILPLYALFPHPQTLLVLQTGMVALGAVPIYLVARRVLLDDRLAVLLAGVFLVSPSTLNLNLFDFHLEAFLPFFLGMFFYFYLVANWRGYAFFGALALLTIDFASLIVAAVCLAHALRTLSLKREGRRLGFHLERSRALILASTIVVSLVTFYLMIELSGIFSGRSTSFQGTISGFITPIGQTHVVLLKSEFWLLPLLTLLFIPLLVPSQLIMVAPYFLVSLLSASHPPNYSFGYQYSGAFVFPYLLLAGIFGMQKLRRRGLKVRGLLVGMLVFSTIISPFNPLMQNRITGIAYEQGFPVMTTHDLILYRALEMIPSKASILTQDNFFPQISNRTNAYVYIVDNRTSIQYVLADSKSRWYSTRIWGTQSMAKWLPYFLSTGRYGIVVNDDGVMLLRANYTGPVMLYGNTNYRFNYQNLYLYAGSTSSDPTSSSETVLVHRTSDQMGVTFWFGPYAPLPPGRYNATFVLKTSGITNGSLQLQVSAFLGTDNIAVLADQNITQASFSHPGDWTKFSLTFEYTPQQAALGTLEFRGVNAFRGPIYLDYINVTYVAPYGPSR